MILPAMLNRILTAALASILFCLTMAPGPAVAEDWPQFLGPRRDGTSLETCLLDKFPEGGPKILWQKDVGTGYSAPSIRDGRLVYHHRLGFEEIVECVDAATGKEIWRYGYGSRYRDPFGYNNGPRCTPLVTDKYVYVYGAEGMLYCLDFKTGRKVWSRNTATDWNVPQPFFGIGSTPILEGDLLIVMVGGQPNSAMVAFNAKTGETVWENIGKDTWNGSYKLGWPGTPPVRWTGTERLSSYATPVAATIHGKRHILCML
ncbi:MAG: outer membrane protein assembly factor BamB, partial [Candidatus Binatia bacterium]